MMRALTTAATGMVAQQFNLDTIANNLANVNTTGFKQQRAEFQDLMYQTMRTGGVSSGTTANSPNYIQVGYGTRVESTAGNFTQGALENTNSPLDVAIQGQGFFKVLRPDGTAAYTRDGNLKADADGSLVTNDGYHIEPNILIPQNSTAITINADGTVSATRPGETTPTAVGNIQLTVFPNPAGLERIGGNLYRQSTASGEPTDTTPGTNGSGSLAQYFLEGSNVQVVEEMTRMITAQRAYEINSKAIQTADDMLSILNGLKR